MTDTASKVCEWCGHIYPPTNKYKYCTFECYYEAGNKKASDPKGREPLLLDDYDDIPNHCSFQDIANEGSE